MKPWYAQLSALVHNSEGRTVNPEFPCTDRPPQAVDPTGHPSIQVARLLERVLPESVVGKSPGELKEAPGFFLKNFAR